MEITKEQVVAKMNALGVEGFSTLGKFTNEELMERLDDIEQMFGGVTSQANSEFSCMEATSESSNGKEPAVATTAARCSGSE